ncbi:MULTISPECIES: hypothetical protein [Nonomuraea]|uniref:Uncharacterized protein n=1 Tax=Nonomuraea mangrovi TaxID=2316207 RepID=A0ABW4T3S2_9ACTN
MATTAIIDVRTEVRRAAPVEPRTFQAMITAVNPIFLKCPTPDFAW